MKTLKKWLSKNPGKQQNKDGDYYPFGLTMAGISSKALGSGYVENKKQFNGIEHTTDLDLNQYDAFYRNFDPQLGRWWQIDPKPNDKESPYASMGNNPILNSDILGDTLTPQQQFQNLLIKKSDNKDGDQTGIIRNAPAELYDKAPVRAFILDVGHFLGEFSGVNSIDNFIGNRIDGRNSSEEIIQDAAIVTLSTTRGAKGGGEKIHSIYGDGVQVTKSQRPARLGDPIVKKGSDGEGYAHTQLMWDMFNLRVYQGREFNAAGQPVRDIDFTAPANSAGQARPGHPIPHQHTWVENPTGGTKIRGPVEPFVPWNP